MPLDRRVALKVLPPERMQNREAVSRFQREMRAIGKLDHPNIVRAQDAGEADGKHFLVMELIDGLDLAALARRRGPLPIADACELVRQAAIGLAHAHEHGLVHRDVKPSNLVVTPAGQVKVLDLGLALLAENVGHGEELTSSGQVMGTLDYMAPEQLGDAHDVDARADIYGLGATLYRLLTGQAPYANKRYDTPTKKLMAIATRPITPVTHLRDDVPVELLATLDRMLAKNPDDRYATAAEVAAALGAFAAASDLPSLVARAAAPAVDAPRSRPSTFDQASSALVDTQPTRSEVFQPASAGLIESRSSLPQPLPRASARRTAQYAAAVVLLLAAGTLLAGVVLRVRTSDGTLVVTLEEGIDASDVVVEIDGERAVSIQTIDEGRALKFSVQPGERALRVETTEGVVLLTQEFTFERGGTRIAHARFAASNAAGDVAQNFNHDADSTAIDVAKAEARSGLPTPEPSLTAGVSTDRDRDAAERILRRGGRVDVWMPNTTTMQVDDIAKLPQKSFRLVAVDLTNCNGCTNDDFSALHDLPDLNTVVLRNVAQATDFLSHLEHLPSLRHLDLNETPIIDDHLRQIVAAVNLESLSLFSTFITDEGARYIGKLRRLKSLNLSSTRLTDAGLRTLAETLQLDDLNIQNASVTNDGLAHIATIETL